ncbi:hypothetical protein GZ77_20770 [Endozoicomonas montiporae]|uniref:Uncharacterized protein n=2 Tax=Endozoicomonas montiporae TaxID=1027273 RepID=A0A081N352_9GAMM|nr:hypothetical protein [Endozoicomonas montiporae]AMO58169.1 hypothetical protein EZMO1_4247 [Endozoicomonas montiporae CL-33]KEQ12875.1 hypothetical protein GZ77_20770 [Endozoicomonas montiporae]
MYRTWSQGSKAFRLSNLKKLFLTLLLFPGLAWSYTGNDYHLLSLMMDGYRLKIQAWSVPDVYQQDGPGADALRLERTITTNLFSVSDEDEQLASAMGDLQTAIQSYALDWQQQGLPRWHYGEGVENAMAAFSAIARAQISESKEANTRAEQIDLLLQMTSVYIFMASEIGEFHPLTDEYDLPAMVAELDKLLTTLPVDDRRFMAKWRFIKPVILKMDFRVPDVVRRHALSMSEILEISLNN